MYAIRSYYGRRLPTPYGTSGACSMRPRVWNAVSSRRSPTFEGYERLGEPGNAVEAAAMVDRPEYRQAGNHQHRLFMPGAWIDQQYQRDRGHRFRGPHPWDHRGVAVETEEQIFEVQHVFGDIAVHRGEDRNNFV